ncbi:MAG: DUF4397 domain-containing protein [Saprospiraceae bacterium]|nr:DUF4397 domain-containing protein [Saprospiraceae bacterium]
MFLLAVLTAGAQNARVQIIHNSPEPVVDVYLDGAILLNDFAFRTATPFVDVPADVQVEVAVAPANSTDVSEALATFPVTFESGKTYIVTASGIVGDANTPFTLNVNDAGRESAANPSLVDVAVLHGSPDAPAVDVDAVFVGNVISDLSYGEFTPYLSLPAAVYDLAIRPAGAPDVVATFRADLSGLAGASAYVFASGLLQGTPSFGLYAALANGTVIALPLTPTARVQIIHNSPSPTVDVWAGETRLVDDFAFRTATPFVTVPADRSIDVGIALGSSTAASESIAVFPATFESGKTYIVTASGIVGDANTPFTLIINDVGRESAANPSLVDVAVLHGSPDAPAVDVDAVFVGNVISDLSYGEFTPYLSLPAAVYDLAIRPAGAPDVVATFRADLSGLAGASAYVFASGLLQGTPSFGLYAALANGTVIALPLTPTARVQIIHNSPSPTVDVWAGETRLLDDFAFRTATPFVSVPADRSIDVGIALGSSTAASESIAVFPATFESGKTYIVTASGIVGDANTPFTLIINDAGRESAANPSLVDVAVLHGSPDAPAVDVDAVFVGNVISDLSYGEFTSYLSLPAAVYDLAIRPAGAPDVVATFRADLSGLAGASAYVFASGLLQGTPSFGLYAALANGTVIALPLTPTARVQIIHNSPSPTVDVWAGETRLVDDFAFRTATPFVTVPADRSIDVGIALGSSTAASESIAVFPATFESGKTYIVTASGIVGDANTPFTLIINDAGRESAANPSLVDVAVLHGSPDAPAVDVDAVFVGNVISDLSYGEFTPYLSLPAAVYDLAIRPAGAPDVVATFRADLSGLAGASAYVFASGLLQGTPSFGLYAAFANGAVVALPLTPTARVQIIHNSPSPTVDVWAGETRLVDDFAFRTATPFVSVPADRTIDIGIALSSSTSADESIAFFPAVFESGKTYTVMAAGIVGNQFDRPFTLFIDDNAQETAADGVVGVSVIHGSPDAPPVDVYERFAGLLLSNLNYGEFTPYLELPGGTYYLDVLPAGQGDPIVGTYEAELSGLEGTALRVFASGFLINNPGLGLYAALPDGTVIELPETRFAEVQLIHNSPEGAVDLYIDDELAIDNFQFRSATPFEIAEAGFLFTVGVAPADSEGPDDILVEFPVSFQNGKIYTVIAGGLLDSPTTPFTLFVNDEARTRAASGSGVDLALFHGAPDAPAVDVQVSAGPVLFDDIAYGTFSDYVNVPARSYVLELTPADDNSTVLISYLADISSLDGQAATVFASGFLGSTPGFETWVALSDGVTFPLPVFVSTSEQNLAVESLAIWPNPAVSELSMQFNMREATAITYRVRDLSGRMLLSGDLGRMDIGERLERLDVNALSSGMYLLEVISEQGILTTKFMVQK